MDACPKLRQFSLIKNKITKGKKDIVHRNGIWIEYGLHKD